MGRIRNAELFRAMHLEGGECVLCGVRGQSLHHVLPRSLGGDDVRENLVWLCGDGVAGCHGLIEARHEHACVLLGMHLLEEEPDVLRYLQSKFGDTEANEFVTRRYLNAGARTAA